MTIEKDNLLQSVSEIKWKELLILELCDEKFSKGKRMWGYVISETSMIPKNIDKGYVALIDV